MSTQSLSSTSLTLPQAGIAIVNQSGNAADIPSVVRKEIDARRAQHKFFVAAPSAIPEMEKDGVYVFTTDSMTTQVRGDVTMLTTQEN